MTTEAEKKRLAIASLASIVAHVVIMLGSQPESRPGIPARTTKHLDVLLVTTNSRSPAEQGLPAIETKPASAQTATTSMAEGESTGQSNENQTTAPKIIVIPAALESYPQLPPPISPETGASLSGSVVLKLHTSGVGTIDRVEILHSTLPSDYVRTITRIFLGQKARPAQIDGRPVTSHIVVTASFSQPSP